MEGNIYIYIMNIGHFRGKIYLLYQHIKQKNFFPDQKKHAPELEKRSSGVVIGHTP